MLNTGTCAPTGALFPNIYLLTNGRATRKELMAIFRGTTARRAPINFMRHSFLFVLTDTSRSHFCCTHFAARALSLSARSHTHTSAKVARFNFYEPQAADRQAHTSSDGGESARDSPGRAQRRCLFPQKAESE
jgi:hypothetical protein